MNTSTSIEPAVTLVVIAQPDNTYDLHWSEDRGFDREHVALADLRPTIDSMVSEIRERLARTATR